MSSASSFVSSLSLLAVLGLASGCADVAGGGEPLGSASQAVAALAPVTGFGSNPGNLLMYSYVPQGMPASAPVVVALHGCTQTAADYESAGWNALADTYKFYVVYPQQQSSNNTESCFNWFGNTSGSTADITRDQGEAASIKQMLDYMSTHYSIDPKRVYVNGLSAGAAYAVALLAMYPDVFAAGASFSGLPFGCATSLSQAYTCQYSAQAKQPSDWAAAVKAAYPSYAGPYPRISVWQGSSDTIVSTSNLGEIVQQWTAVHGVSSMPTATATVGSATHSTYADANGVVQVESYSVSGMGHAVAIDTAHGCGTAGTYFADEGLCAVDLAAKFFGLEGAQPPPSGSSSGGGSGSSSGTGSSSGGSGSSSGWGGWGGSGSGSGSGAGAPDGGAGGSASPVDGGAAAAPELPGCTMARGGRAEGGAWLLGLVLGTSALLRRRSGRIAS